MSSVTVRRINNCAASSGSKKCFLEYCNTVEGLGGFVFYRLKILSIFWLTSTIPTSPTAISVPFTEITSFRIKLLQVADLSLFCPTLSCQSGHLYLLLCKNAVITYRTICLGLFRIIRRFHRLNLPVFLEESVSRSLQSW